MHDKPMILVVDDEETICDLIYDGLVEEGFTCDIASNASDALTKLERQSYDIALLDIVLPGISGVDLLKMIESRSPTTAIIMVSGMNDLQTAVEIMKMGASDYIVKPFTLNQLNSSINTLLNSKNSTLTAMTSTATGTVTIR